MNGKESYCNGGDTGLIPVSRRSPKGGHGNLQYSRLENSMGRGAWQVQSVGQQKSRKWLSDWHTHMYHETFIETKNLISEHCH